MSKDSPSSQAPEPFIERHIYVIRGQKVMLDSDLAELYQVPTKALNQAAKRNPDRFPADFMFQLTSEELQALASQFAMLNLRSQIVTSSHGGRRARPYAFTEHGVAMLSSVLSSTRAVLMNILIIRAFVKLRELLATNKDLARNIEQIESAQEQHARTQEQQTRTSQQHTSILVSVVQDIRKLKNPPITRAIGFVPRSPKKK
jgi:phage regulator Rha-like protein